MRPAFADALARTGIDVVSIANNHMLDAESTGLADTIALLSAAGVATAGGGHDLAAARRPALLERNGQQLAILAYSQYSNIATGFALPGRAGVAPLDPDLAEADIRRHTENGHAVIVSLHWGIENTSTVREEERELARGLVDAGAKLVLGHGPHVPRSVELYRGSIIVYSLGNFVFGHGHDYWSDNYLVRATFVEERVSQVEILPVAGAGTDVGQPFPLEGERATQLLQALREQSGRWGTRVQMDGTTGLVRSSGP